MERVTLTGGLKLAAAIALGLMIALLAINNLQIAAQLKVVEQQRDFQAQADPLVRDGRILAQDLRDRLPQARRDARAAAALVRDTRPLVADVEPLVGELSEALPAIRTASRRAPGFMESALELLRNALDVQRNTRELQREALRVNRESLAVQRETLAIQKEALTHIRSIDQKTGGTAPAALP
jgi:hypothetical protein